MNAGEEIEVLYPYPGDNDRKKELAVYIEGGKTLTIEEMEKALYEARNLVQSIGTVSRPTTDASRWLEKYFPGWD